MLKVGLDVDPLFLAVWEVRGTRWWFATSRVVGGSEDLEILERGWATAGFPALLPGSLFYFRVPSSGFPVWWT